MKPWHYIWGMLGYPFLWKGLYAVFIHPVNNYNNYYADSPIHAGLCSCGQQSHAVSLEGNSLNIVLLLLYFLRLLNCFIQCSNY